MSQLSFSVQFLPSWYPFGVPKRSQDLTRGRHVARHDIISVVKDVRGFSAAKRVFSLLTVLSEIGSTKSTLEELFIRVLHCQVQKCNLLERAPPSHKKVLQVPAVRPFARGPLTRNHCRDRPGCPGMSDARPLRDGRQQNT